MFSDIFIILGVCHLLYITDIILNHFINFSNIYKKNSSINFFSSFVINSSLMEMNAMVA